MGIRYLCKYDDSDEDCYRCTKHGYIFSCKNCKDFYDVRQDMSPEMLALRQAIMDKLNLKD